ncbi:MAG: hypothetical protein K6B72_02870 [Lachnospiraceae bacterium]|nr:hypothetical protein [Lachnospiraceae bacterium]
MMTNADLVEGQAIVTGINLGIHATAEASELFEITSINEEDEEVSFSSPMDAGALRTEAMKPFLFSYCCGVASYMRENYHVGGVRIVISDVTLPMKKGLSSSAAVCVLVAKAFNELYSLRISTRGLMQIAYRGELLTGSRCGRLDQACAYGERPVLMHFSQNEIDVETMRVGQTFHYVIADLCAGKDTKKILAYLNKAYPFATNDTDAAVQEALGPDNHKIIAHAREAIERGDAVRLGQLMFEAQELFDRKVAPACPDELTSPVLHSVLNDPKIRDWIYGAKGVGSQGDGTVQLLARDKKSQLALVDYLNNERHMEAFAFRLNAGGKIKKAVIPIAGNGTRMFPETFFIKKAMLPVMDESGTVKPALLYMLEELVACEIEDIYLIVGADEVEYYEHLFHFDYDEEYRSKLPENVRDYYKEIFEIGQRVSLVVQEEKKGFGHAVYQARKYLNNEPAVLLLGDFLYKSNLELSCTQQTINAYNKSGGKAVVSVKVVPVSDSRHYGIIHGVFRSDRSYILDVDAMVEKPDEEYAKENLLVEGKCYATFGSYVLTDDVFEYLEHQIKENEANREHSEIDLTKALMNAAKNGNLVGVDIDGTSYDVGLPKMYYKTFCAFGKE